VDVEAPPLADAHRHRVTDDNGQAKFEPFERVRTRRNGRSLSDAKRNV
jgi:hypothetical protein